MLTDQRIYFTPWNTKDIAAIESWVLPKVGAPKIAGQAVGLVQCGVLAGGVWTPNWSRENVVKRDEFLRAANS